jgi:hypothetical protein
MSADEMKQCVARLRTDIYWLRLERSILKQLEGKDHVGVDFFKVVHVAIHADHLVRFGRLLDRDGQAITIWTMRRWKAEEVDAALSAHGLTMRELNRLAERFYPLRSKILAHNDTSAVLDRDALFQKAGIKGQEIDGTADRLWLVVGEVYTRWFNEPAPDGDPYTGDDVDEIHRRYMAWRSPQGQDL